MDDEWTQEVLGVVIKLYTVVKIHKTVHIISELHYM